MGFHRHVLNYFWTSVNGGRGRQHLMDGTTVEHSYAPGETRHETYGPGEYKVHDLENLGDQEMIFNTIEFLDSANKPLPVPDTRPAEGGVMPAPSFRAERSEAEKSITTTLAKMHRLWLWIPRSPLCGAEVAKACTSALRLRHEAIEERRELRIAVERQNMRDVLVRPHDHHAAPFAIDAAHGEDVLPLLRSGQNIFS